MLYLYNGHEEDFYEKVKFNTKFYSYFIKVIFGLKYIFFFPPISVKINFFHEIFYSKNIQFFPGFLHLFFSVSCYKCKILSLLIKCIKRTFLCNPLTEILHLPSQSNHSILLFHFFIRFFTNVVN